MPEVDCPVCKSAGNGEFPNPECVHCNGTGEFTRSAEGFMKYHTCQCILHDRRNCIICRKPCHHDTNGRPKVLLTPM